RIVQSSVPRSASADAWRVDDEPLLVLGGGPDGDLYDVAGAVRLSDGKIVVGDGGSGRVRFFDRDGGPLGSVGGRGEGPGEFVLLQSLGVGHGDTVWAYDFQLQRMSFFTAPGTLTRVVSLRPRLPSGVPVGYLTDGTLLLAQMWGSGDPSAPLTPGVRREAAAYVRYDASGSLVDTLGLFPGREVLLSLEEGRAVMGAIPFGRTASHTVFGDGFVVGDQVRHELGVFAADGLLVGILRWAGPSLELAEADVEAWRAAQLSSAAPARRAQVRAHLAGVPVPDRRPAYRDLLADEKGALWVGAYAHAAETARRWDVFGPGGPWLSSVEMPPGFRPTQIGPDWILGIARDALGVERIELRPLQR
ncbi:MAG: hypothetical protein P8170_18945, partial [Gemmatimonadota bacterium]